MVPVFQLYHIQSYGSCMSFYHIEMAVDPVYHFFHEETVTVLIFHLHLLKVISSVWSFNYRELWFLYGHSIMYKELWFPSGHSIMYKELLFIYGHSAMSRVMVPV